MSNKYQVVIQPRGEQSVTMKVGGFDSRDALTQGKHRWVSEQEGRKMYDIESVSVFPLAEERVA